MTPNLFGLDEEATAHITVQTLEGLVVVKWIATIFRDILKLVKSKAGAPVLHALPSDVAEIISASLVDKPRSRIGSVVQVSGDVHLYQPCIAGRRPEVIFIKPEPVMSYRQSLSSCLTFKSTVVIVKGVLLQR